ncbi:hypothetical protein QR680_013712 [Steinernema hermaphroditum]|uniref:Uncharacterized protein n=1 Tax=Steinernema hermaphroditum TaxID=289476 RepID=A0AA39M2Y8_9BILA|nr:hypothetical protein QR680_013712 [Steinernema hermaphroditum]
MARVKFTPRRNKPNAIAQRHFAEMRASMAAKMAAASASKPTLLSHEDASLLGASLSDGLKVIESYATLVQNLFAYCDEDIDDSVEEDATEQVIKSLVTMREECQSITQDLANMAANIQKSLRK